MSRTLCHWRRTALLMGLSAALAGSVLAADPDPCLDAADDRAMLACRQAGLAAAHQRLDEALARLKARYLDDEPARWQLLRNAQAAWRRFAVAECRFQHQESAGTATHAVALLACQTRLSERRLDDLQAVLATP